MVGKVTRFVLYFFWFPLVLIADDTIRQGFEVEEVEVVAKYFDRDIIRPQTLGEGVLREVSALSIADALRYLAGVQIKDYGGVAGIKTIDIRSMGSNHVGVYYNGIPVGNAQNGQVDLGKFSLDNIDQIDLYNGQKSDIFQSAREFGYAGGVYLTSRKPRFKNGEVFHVKGQVGVGSFGLINPSALLEVKLGDAISASVSAELVSATGRYKFRYRRLDAQTRTVRYDTTDIRRNGDIHAIRVEGGLNHYYSNSGFWKLSLYHYNSERGIPGAIINNDFNSGERQWDRNSFVQCTWQDEFFHRWSVKINSKYANDYIRYINYDANDLYSENVFLQQEVYLSLTNKIRVFRWWDVAVSYDFQRNVLSKHLSASRNSHWLALATAFNIKEYIRCQGSVLGTFVNDLGGNSVKRASDERRWTPGVFLSIHPLKNNKISVHAFYKHSYRYPTFNDLYYTESGNADLNPELAKQADVGISSVLPFRIGSVSGSDWHIEIDGYHNDVRNKIIAYPKGQQFRWTMLNLGKVDIWGLDVSSAATLILPKDFSLTFQFKYTYQKAIDVSSASTADSIFYKHQIPYIPWHSGSFVGMFRWRRYVLNYSFIYVGERYVQQQNTAENHVQAWYTHDISISGTWVLNEKKRATKVEKRSSPVELKVSLDINNLLSQDYELIRNYPMPKTNYRCVVSLSY